MYAEGSVLSPKPSRHSSRRLRLALEALLFLLLFAGLLTWGVFRELRTLTPLAQTFNCTVYYTPIESAFQENKGFNLRPETRPGLNGNLYPADFLKAVALEGFGKLKNPSPGKEYLYFNGHWGYAQTPMGNQSNPLQGKLSCAVTTRNGKLAPGNWIVLRSKELPLTIEARPWRIDDTGPGVGLSQLDLYWGEDDPSGPGDGLERPAGLGLTRVRQVSVYQIPRKSPLLRSLLALQNGPLSGLAPRLFRPLMDSALKTTAVAPSE